MRRAKSGRSKHPTTQWERGVNRTLAYRIHELIALGARHGIVAHVTSARRTHRQQVALYRRYQRGLSLYPVAPPGYSNHERGLEVDLWAGSSAATRALGALAPKVGLSWPLGVKDEVHFELP